MSQVARQIMDVLYVSEPTSRNFIQHFQFFNQLITHQHEVEVTHLQQEELLEIRNYLTIQKEGKLFKVTEITLENRMIRIIDSISCISNPKLTQLKHQTISDNQRNIKKVQPAKNTTLFRLKQAQRPNVKLKDTKNVVKNIIRLFQAWLEEGCPSQRAVYDQLLDFVERIKYNNNLIIKLFRNSSLRAAFIQFSRRDGREFIQKSKINDKNSHYQALQRYTQLFEQEERSRDNRQDETPIEVVLPSQ